MSIDAQAWVWNESRTKGNARIVMLAVADKAPGPDCTARMGLTEFIKRLNAARSTVIEAIDKALDSGELVVVEPAKGSRAATYQLPFAVGYVKPTLRRGPDSGPVVDSQGSGFRTGNSEQGSGFRTGSEIARGPETGPGGSEIRTPSGPETGPLYQTTSTKGGSIERSAPAGPLIPAFANDLVQQMTAAGMVVSWSLAEPEWFAVHAHIKRCGIPFMVEFTRARWNHNDPPQTARYLTKIWQSMPDRPAEGPTGLPALRAVPTPGAPAGPITNNQMRRNLLAEAAAQLAAGGPQ
ncbi:MAG: hypothetical protein HOY69_24580 [Streptomyces sp.]|nr:hypothetical protein [Streptomyces sp.]